MVYTSSIVRIEGGSVIVESSQRIAADAVPAFPGNTKRSRRTQCLKGFRPTALKQRRRKR